MEITEINEEARPGDLLVGAGSILNYLVFLGMPEDTDVYYLRRAGLWPIGKSSGEGGKLIASKRRLAEHANEITRGRTAARPDALAAGRIKAAIARNESTTAE